MANKSKDGWDVNDVVEFDSLLAACVGRHPSFRTAHLFLPLVGRYRHTVMPADLGLDENGVRLPPKQVKPDDKFQVVFDAIAKGGKGVQ